LNEWLAATMKSLGVAFDGAVRDARWNDLFEREYGHKFVNSGDSDEALVGSEAAMMGGDACDARQHGRAFDREASDAGSYLLPECGAKWCAWWVWTLGKSAARRVVDGSAARRRRRWRVACDALGALSRRARATGDARRLTRRTLSPSRRRRGVARGAERRRCWRR
jgi:YD repeat-containing protein